MPPKKSQQGNSSQESTDFKEISPYLASISKSFAVIALRLSPIKLTTDAERANFLKGLGLENVDIAKILSTTPGTIKVRLSEAKKSSKRTKHSGKN